MREFGLFLLAIAATIAVLMTVDLRASSSRQPPPVTSFVETRK